MGALDKPGKCSKTNDRSDGSGFRPQSLTQFVLLRQSCSEPEWPLVNTGDPNSFYLHECPAGARCWLQHCQGSISFGQKYFHRLIRSLKQSLNIPSEFDFIILQILLPEFAVNIRPSRCWVESWTNNCYPPISRWSFQERFEVFDNYFITPSVRFDGILKILNPFPWLWILTIKMFWLYNQFIQFYSSARCW